MKIKKNYNLKFLFFALKGERDHYPLPPPPFLWKGKINIWHSNLICPKPINLCLSVPLTINSYGHLSPCLFFSTFSLSFYLSLFICPSIHMVICLLAFLFHIFSFFLSVSLHLSIHSYGHLSACLFFSTCLSFFLSVSLFICPSIHMVICLLAFLFHIFSFFLSVSLHLCIHSYGHLSACLFFSTCLSFFLSVSPHLSIHSIALPVSAFPSVCLSLFGQAPKHTGQD